jgi:hypothetical protein
MAAVVAARMPPAAVAANKVRLETSFMASLPFSIARNAEGVSSGSRSMASDALRHLGSGTVGNPLPCAIGAVPRDKKESGVEFRIL